ncbi:uncharacterized protein C12orf56-like [Gigantopelta aegis]|uniref:uncharacterized protein C12orf56-like n=1 Tax=Gigantopelta aegis TaxID=1735272 RepID=UPI001B88B084|nr:uncharacterized protein C12orf56-like [Gigantopelta aegis]
MARGISDLLVKKNSKLESYLKRFLSEETYERIRAYESCIIFSEKEKKAFKYVVLGDEWIYLTENPPKTIQQTVHLGDVIDVELVNDVAEFFSKDERKNILHLQVTYLTTEPIKKQWRRSFRRVRSESVIDVVGGYDRSNVSTPMGYAESVDSFTEDTGYYTQSTASSQPTRPDSETSSLSNKDSARGSVVSKKKKKLNDSLDHDSYLQALKEIEEDDQEDKSLKKILSVPNSHPAAGDHVHSRKKPHVSKTAVSQNLTNSLTQNSKQSTPAVPNGKDLAAQDVPKKGVSPIGDGSDSAKKSTNCCWPIVRKRSSTQVTQDPKQMETKESPRTTSVDFTAVSQEQRPLVPLIEVDSFRRSHGSMVSFTDRPSSRLSADIFSVRGSISKSRPLENERNRSSLGYATMSDLGDSINNLNMLSASGRMEKRPTQLHIYLLNPTSPMHMLIKSAWNNFLIRSTLMLNPEFKQACLSPSIHGTQTLREKAEYLFNQLKREILDPSNTMEETFASLTELKNATEKNFALKKLFWRNSDLFLTMVRLLQLYLPKSPININTEQGRDTRIDEFTFVTLITEILSQEFRETEVIPSRIQTLKSERGKAVLDLLMALTCSPELPEKYGSLSKKADEELHQQFEEFTRAAVMAVFELFLMAQQANWNHSEGNFFNICWMVRVLEEIRTTEKFVERVINQMMELLSPSKLDTLVPEEAVMLYQQFSIISSFLDYSPRITNFIRNNYEEEFKYFIQVPAVAKKLPSQYPLSSHTMHLMDQVINKVLSSSSISSSRLTCTYTS